MPWNPSSAFDVRSRCVARGMVALLATAGTTGGVAAAELEAGAGAFDPNHPPSRCSTRVEDRNLETFRAYLALLTGGNIEQALTYFAPKAIVVSYGSTPFKGTYSATDGTWGALQQRYWDLAAAGEAQAPVLYADCNKVILNGQFRRTARATGRIVDTRVIEYFTFNREGKITRDDFYLADTDAVNKALGVD